MAEVPERERLDIKIRSTIQFEFGSICDEVDRWVKAGVINPDCGRILKRLTRNCGNNAIRVIANHLDFVTISRNHRKDEPNLERVAHEATKG